MLEWSRPTDGWQMLAPDSTIDDACFAVALPVRPLAEAASTDDVVARALLAKHTPVLTDALTRSRDEGQAKGKVEGKADALLARA